MNRLTKHLCSWLPWSARGSPATAGLLPLLRPSVLGGLGRAGAALLLLLVLVPGLLVALLALPLQQLGHHADAEALGVAAVDAALGGGGDLAVLAARLAALQPLLVDPLHRAPEEGAA